VYLRLLFLHSILHCLLSFKLYYIFWFYVSSHDIAQHAKTHSIKSQFKHFSLDIVVADARLAYMKMRRWGWFSTERKSLCKYILFLLFIYFLIVDFIFYSLDLWFLTWLFGMNKWLGKRRRNTEYESIKLDHTKYRVLRRRIS